MKKLLVCTLPLAALAACSGGGTTDADTDGDGEISGDEMQAEVEAAAEQINVRPGLWETSFEITELEIPNAPPEMQNMMGAMRGQMAQSMGSTSCLTPEEAENLESNMFDDDDSCSVSEFEMSGGTMTVAATCQEPGGPVMNMRMEGTYTETTANMTMSADGEIPQMGAMRFAGNFTRRHISDDCGAEG